MARFNSLLARNKFPVPLRRELGRKPLYLALDSKPIVALEGPDEEFGFRDGFARDCLLLRRCGASCSRRCEGSEPFEELWLALPNWSSGRPRRRCRRDLARLQRFLLHPDVDFGVAVGRIQADVTEPAPDDIDVDARFEQMNSRRMTKDMRRDGALVLAGRNHRARWRHCLTAALQQLIHHPCGLGPQWTGSPLVTLAMQIDARRGCQYQLADGEADNFGRPCPCI